MIELFNKATGERIGELTEIQFDFLIDNIENEYLEDITYVIDKEIIILLKKRGSEKRGRSRNRRYG